MTSKEKVLVPVLFGIIGVLTIGLFWPASEDSTPATVQASKPTIDRSPAKQAQRQELVQKMIDQGYIRNIRITAQGTPVVTVSNAFLAGDLTDKQNLISVIYALHFDGTQGGQVRLVSAQTGKEIGWYMMDIGLQIK